MRACIASYVRWSALMASSLMRSAGGLSWAACAKAGATDMLAIMAASAAVNAAMNAVARGKCLFIAAGSG